MKAHISESKKHKEMYRAPHASSLPSEAVPTKDERIHTLEAENATLKAELAALRTVSAEEGRMGEEAWARMKTRAEKAEAIVQDVRNGKWGDVVQALVDLWKARIAELEAKELICEVCGHENLSTLRICGDECHIKKEEG
jgi:hypothetical protein